MTAKRLNAYIFLLITAVIWGIAGVVIKLTLVEIDPAPFLVYRFGISAAIAVLFLIFSKRIHIRSKAEGIMIFTYGFLSTTVALGLLFLGADKTTVLNLTIITLGAPLFVELAGAFFLKEHLTHREKIGTGVAFLGTALVVVGPIANHIQESSNIVGNILILLYLVADIASIIYLKKLLRLKYSSLALTNTSFVIGFVTILPISIFLMPISQTISQITSLPLPYHLGVWYMAVFSGTIAYYMRGVAQKTVEVSEAGLFGYITPVVTGILAVALLNESLTPLFVLGAVIVALGVTLAEYKPKML
jgi:drug/metabolite transporter (DMT)-like permease